jgi:hypothetical protein
LATQELYKNFNFIPNGNSCVAMVTKMVNLVFIYIF